MNNKKQILDLIKKNYFVTYVPFVAISYLDGFIAPPTCGYAHFRPFWAYVKLGEYLHVGKEDPNFFIKEGAYEPYSYIYKSYYKGRESSP